MNLDNIIAEVSLILNKDLYDLEIIDYQLFLNTQELLLKKLKDLDI